MTQQTLTTPRLILRPFTLSDTPDLATIRHDPEAMRHWDWPHDESLAQTTRIANQMHADTRAQKSLYWTAKTQNNIFIGIFDLSDLTPHTADLGFQVPRNLWGQGYATEATTALITEAWHRGLSTLTARIHEGNTRSARLLTRLGFADQGCTQQETRLEVSKLCRTFCLSINATK